MAQAISLAPEENGAVGDSVQFTARVQFIGTDLPNGPDSSMVLFTVGPGDTPVIIRDKFANAIKAEAVRLGYSLPVGGILLPSYVRV